jgi:colanic acid/amylovoran biosynthesis glycosyltransferase
MTSCQNFIVYREELLGASETFVVGQAESLPHFRPFYLGLRRRSGLTLPESQVHIVGRDGLAGKLRRARFKLSGPSQQLRSMLAAKNPVLIHAHFAPDGSNAVVLARSLDLPLIVTLHGYDVSVNDVLLPRLYIQRRELLKARASRFICVSEFVRKQAIAKGFPADKLIVHYTGIDVEAFSARPNVSCEPVVLFVGRLVPKKGCEYLIRAMARVQQVAPAASLIVIGDGRLREQLQRQASGALRNFRFIGEQEPTVVRNYMNHSKVFCAPSVVARSGDAEGFGMIFAEAQAMGLPIASFASGGIPEAVADEQTGFLVPERDVDALAKKLLLLLSNKDVWSRMSDSGRLRARQLFDIRKQATLLENIYDDVMSEWNGNARIDKIRRTAAATDEYSCSIPIDIECKESPELLALSRTS